MTHSKYLAALLASALALGGCATIRGGSDGEELVGHSMRMEARNGQVTRLTFNEDGTVRAAFGNNSVTGRWDVTDNHLCFFWSGAPRECWPYRGRFVRGQTRTLTSDRGNEIRVTLL